MNFRVRSVLCATTLIAAACTGSKPEAPAEQKPAPAEPAAAAPAKVNDAAVASVSGKSDPDCLGPIDTGVPEVVALGDRKAERNGYRLVLQGEEDADERAVLGVLANINEASAENLFNLDRYLGFFRENGAELIVVAGDSGQSREEIEAVLRKVAAAGLPVVAIPGNREAKADFVDAVAAVRKDAPHLIDGNRVRWIDWDDVDLVTLPGYHDPRYMHAGGAGCQYFKQDVEALRKLAADTNDPAVLVAHGQPLGEAPTALDVIAPDGKHVGDANLNPLLTAATFPFGIFPNIKEAGAKAVADAGGKTVIAEGTPSETLYLHPGAADSIEWKMNDGSSIVGTAALLTIEGGKATHRIYRATRLTEAERAEAAKLVPARATAQTE